MSFSEHQITELTHKIASLPDQPNMQPDELKQYFDSSPEELRQAHNGLCGALAASTAAAGIGFERTSGVPKDTVQDAIEDVQKQLTDAVLGKIPSGSVNGDKLAQDVRDRFTAIENAASTEAALRQQTDEALQSQLFSVQDSVAQKCEVYIGTYIGDAAESQFIPLGFTPRAVLVSDERGFFNEGTNFYGGLALKDHSITSVTIEEGGFRAYMIQTSQLHWYANTVGTHFYIAIR